MTREALRPFTVATAIAVVAAGAFAGAIAAPTQASAHWSCGRSAPPDLDTTGAANMRVGSSTRCAESGVSYSSQSLDYHCYALDINGVDTWTYVANVQARVGG
ncbi:hypothetical protein [Micromonospora cremea]|uniref:Uncharacterized protein n=1 Tax=Micromonospora cremea TaxID=709881 RepID=A0A1N5V901_9ACTN|nr:hypothetical protein [Micromonospora cremea]SIM69008.1 hypothetical protein SAMN04489832_1425 [Micromonospora cremea]